MNVLTPDCGCHGQDRYVWASSPSVLCACGVPYRRVETYIVAAPISSETWDPGGEFATETFLCEEVRRIHGNDADPKVLRRLPYRASNPYEIFYEVAV